jgi:2',3'-cyclic-nucleotide 2'-phosphodiesterase (5'-nucleotidase family)
MKLKILILSCLAFCHFKAEAKLFQILHTNDTHSFLDNSTHDKNRGGVARLKSLIDFYKDKMKAEGISTLTLDAGDFTEGNLYYMADAAKKSFNVQNNIGYDVVTMGNHDYLMGAKDLDSILGEMDLSFAFLAANVTINPHYKNIQDSLVPYKEFNIDGVKFGIFGVTTNEIFYNWRFEAGKITNPFKSALKYEEILKKRNNDVIIGLTHLGYLKDMKLGLQSKEVDLLIGGHSHTALFKPIYVKNRFGKSVPIVQAGQHTEFLGRIIINVEKNRPIQIVSYELVPLKYESKDEKMNALVEEANNDLAQLYGKEWLEKEVGRSDLQAGDPDGAKKWAYFITDTMKEKSHADIAIHTPLMNGEDYPIGVINRKDLINSMPRVFDLQDKYGWSIYTTRIKGIWLQLVFEAIARFGQPLTFSGITMVYIKTPIGIKIRQILVNGKRINPFKSYTVAFTEGIVRGAEGVSKYTSAILRHPRKTPYRIWATLEETLLRDHKSINMHSLTDENRTSYNPDLELPFSE